MYVLMLSFHHKPESTPVEPLFTLHPTVSIYVQTLQYKINHNFEEKIQIYPRMM